MHTISQILMRFFFASFEFETSCMRMHLDTRLFHRKHSFSKTAEGFSLWGKHLARPIQHDISHNVYPERRDGRCHDVLTFKEGYLTLSPGGGWETKGESACQRWPEHCDPKWPRLLVTFTCIHISTSLRKKVDTRLFHRKHSFSKTAEEFSLWGKHLARPIQHDISHNVYPERRDGRCHDVLTFKEGYLTLSPRWICHWYPPPDSH